MGNVPCDGWLTASSLLRRWPSVIPGKREETSSTSVWAHLCALLPLWVSDPVQSINTDSVRGFQVGLKALASLAVTQIRKSMSLRLINCKWRVDSP